MPHDSPTMKLKANKKYGTRKGEALKNGDLMKKAYRRDPATRGVATSESCT